MAAGDPTGPDLASVTVTTENFPHNLPAWREYVFDSPTSLVIGKQYAVVVGTPDSLFADELRWGQDTNAGYGGGYKFLSGDGGVVWTQSPTRDCVFRLNSAGGQVQSFETQDEYQDIFVPWYAAQVFTANSSFDIVSVGLILITHSTSSTRTVIISIRAVEVLFEPPVASGLNNMKTIRRLVAAANNKFWIEDI